jgi:hypothetical protein
MEDDSHMKIGFMYSDSTKSMYTDTEPIDTAKGSSIDRSQLYYTFDFFVWASNSQTPESAALSLSPTS